MASPTPGLRRRASRTLFLALLLSAPLTPAAAQDADASPEQRAVFAAERAFAQSMADRDLAAFTSHVSAEAVFYGGRILRGRDEVVAGWSAFFEGEQAPFSWAPDHVEVLASGTLAHSSGPVLDPSGTRVGTFNSVWRLEADGVWRVVFDKGCNCPG